MLYSELTSEPVEFNLLTEINNCGKKKNSSAMLKVKFNKPTIDEAIQTDSLKSFKLEQVRVACRNGYTLYKFQLIVLDRQVFNVHEQYKRN
ncbi:hypothetical protein KSF78_0007136 [Schistosoma japonicum]|nr:hypothetical protein KSF78_0007136 [Schistosoma japonicum]